MNDQAICQNEFVLLHTWIRLKFAKKSEAFIKKHYKLVVTPFTHPSPVEVPYEGGKAMMIVVNKKKQPLTQEDFDQNKEWSESVWITCYDSYAIGVFIFKEWSLFISPSSENILLNRGNVLIHQFAIKPQDGYNRGGWTVAGRNWRQIGSKVYVVVRTSDGKAIQEFDLNLPQSVDKTPFDFNTITRKVYQHQDLEDFWIEKGTSLYAVLSTGTLEIVNPNLNPSKPQSVVLMNQDGSDMTDAARIFSSIEGNESFIVLGERTKSTDTRNLWLLNRKGKLLDRSEEPLIAPSFLGINVIHKMQLFLKNKTQFLLVNNLFEEGSLYFITKSKRPKIILIQSLIYGTSRLNFGLVPALFLENSFISGNNAREALLITIAKQ